VCIVDQGGETSALEYVSPSHQNLRVIHAPPTGISVARNLGVRATKAPVIAFTDDDCEVEHGWLEGVAAAFIRDPAVGLVFGSVRAANYDRHAGLIPAYDAGAGRTIRTVAGQSRVGGIGACMAIRRSVFEALHGFDEQLGTGAPLCAAEDTDVAIRALIAGYAVCETPAAVVTHLGFRTWEQGRADIRRYMIGLGAAYAKMLRLAGPTAVRPILDLAWRWLFAGPVVDLNHRPPRLMRLGAFLTGARRGWQMPINPATGCFDTSREGAATGRRSPVSFDLEAGGLPKRVGVQRPRDRVGGDADSRSGYHEVVSR
jgi:hypothetical protein